MRSLTFCWGEAQCIQNAEILEKGALILLLTMGASIILVCVGVILYHAWKAFILLSDALGAHLLHAWRNAMYLRLAWIALTFLVMYLLGQYWPKGMVPYLFFATVVYSYMIRPRPKA